MKCPSCQSPHPHRHPAVQFEGEVEICTDDFHLTPTAQNKPEYIAQVHEKRARAALQARAARSDAGDALQAAIKTGLSYAQDARRYRFWRKHYSAKFAICLSATTPVISSLMFKPTRPQVEPVGPDYEAKVDAALDAALASPRAGGET